MKKLTLAPGARRALVFLLVGCGWLSILGNSPPTEYTKKPGARSGPITIQFNDGLYNGGCRTSGTVSSPVRRAALFRGDKLLHEVICSDSTNCLRTFSFPPNGNECSRVLPDSSPPDRQTPDLSPDLSADVSPDVSPDVSSDVSPDVSPDSSLDVSPDLSSDATSAFDTATSDAVSSSAQPLADDRKAPQMWRCPREAGPPTELQVFTDPYASYGECEDEKVVYKVVVETADGVQSTQEYKIDIKEPGGYFGC